MKFRRKLGLISLLLGFVACAQPDDNNNNNYDYAHNRDLSSSEIGKSRGTNPDLSLVYDLGMPDTTKGNGNIDDLCKKYDPSADPKCIAYLSFDNNSYIDLCSGKKWEKSSGVIAVNPPKGFPGAVEINGGDFVSINQRNLKGKLKFGTEGEYTVALKFKICEEQKDYFKIANDFDDLTNEINYSGIGIYYNPPFGWGCVLKDSEGNFRSAFHPDFKDLTLANCEYHQIVCGRKDIGNTLYIAIDGKEKEVELLSKINVDSASDFMLANTPLGIVNSNYNWPWLPIKVTVADVRIIGEFRKLKGAPCN
ncbi:hypothetical protein HYU23_00985 [Candidatus Woesearchaeota archaeon]|nr:hypothetical protein [Candidatus Woesearchaeota archaeon]